jgi:NAD(P)-dependent dehydrogenase (short-subunit alcohol dehydrogenase family)
MPQKIWFITGVSRGFGKIWAEAALARGDKVAATARNIDALKDLSARYGERVCPLALDVTDRAAVFAAVDAARTRFGRLDVVVNNAGYGLFGSVEDITEEQARAQMETNFFGTLWVTQAVLPVLRAQGSGHILQVSSIAGVAAFPNLGLYHASKWAVEGMSEALSREVAGFGIHVTLVEPGPYGTDWRGSSAVHAPKSAPYEKSAFAGSGLPQGDPAATALAILKLVDAENPPLRLFLGSGVLDVVRGIYDQRIKTWEDWLPVSMAAQGN